MRYDLPNSFASQDSCRSRRGHVAVAVRRIRAGSAAEHAAETPNRARGGETLPVIGLGTAVVFNIGANAPERAGPTAVVRTFVGSGATLIDTAPSYGTRETVAGDILTATSLRPRVFKRWLERGPRVASLRARVSPPVRRCVATSVLHSKRRRMKRLARPAHVGCSVQLLCGRQSLR